MQGYLISFFTQQDRRHQGSPMAEWLVAVAQELGLPGATVFAGSEGFGHRHQLHAAHFFELADQPVEIRIALADDDAARLFDRLRAEGVHLFYIKTPVEFGVLGSPD